MDCINCGTPNPKDAVFCKKCGKRLDGMEVCPACGKLTPADGDFCVNCGANKSVSSVSAAARPAPAPAPVSPAAYAAVSVPMEEAAAAAVVGTGVAVAEETVQEEGYMFGKYRGILKKVSSLCAALTALMGIIFVFLIDYSITVTASGASASASSGYDIFYFFGDAYDAITSGLTSYAENTLTAGTVFGTLCCVVGMVVTIVCFLAAVGRMLKGHSGKTEKGLLAPCAATFISFVCTAALFMMCVSSGTSISSGGSSVETSYTLGGAAIAGIVLGAIFLVISVAADVMANLRRERLNPSALNGVFSAAMAAFGFVALGVMAGGLVSYVADTDLLGSLEYTYGAYTLFASGIYAIAATLSSRGSNSDFTDMYSAEVALMVVFVIAAIAFCIFLTAALSKILAGRGEDISSKTIKLVVLAGLCAVICGGMMLGSTLVFVDYLGSDYEASLVVPIVVIVFGVLLAAAAIAYKKRYNISALSPYLA